VNVTVIVTVIDYDEIITYSRRFVNKALSFQEAREACLSDIWPEDVRIYPFRLPKFWKLRKSELQRQVVATDRQIDKLVYELYDLTEEEIRIVEGIGT
jgi:hypothetical protein